MNNVKVWQALPKIIPKCSICHNDLSRNDILLTTCNSCFKELR